MATTSVASRIEAEFGVGSPMVEVSRCESGLRQFDASNHVLRGRMTPADVGAMQINVEYHGETAKKLGFNIYSLEGNIGYAKYLYDKNGLRDWSASKSCWSKNLDVS